MDEVPGRQAQEVPSLAQGCGERISLFLPSGGPETLTAPSNHNRLPRTPPRIPSLWRLGPHEVNEFRQRTPTFSSVIILGHCKGRVKGPRFLNVMGQAREGAGGRTPVTTSPHVSAVLLTSPPSPPTPLDLHASWAPEGVYVAKGAAKGDSLVQLTQHKVLVRCPLPLVAE